jgi:hypothetical protein
MTQTLGFTGMVFTNANSPRIHVPVQTSPYVDIHLACLLSRLDIRHLSHNGSYATSLETFMVGNPELPIRRRSSDHYVRFDYAAARLGPSTRACPHPLRALLYRGSDILHIRLPLPASAASSPAPLWGAPANASHRQVVVGALCGNLTHLVTLFPAALLILSDSGRCARI